MLFTISLSAVHLTHWMFSGSSHFSPNHRSRYSVSLVNFWHFFTLFYNGRFLLIFPLFSFRLRPWGLIHASERRKRGIDSSYPRILLDERPFRIRVNPPPGSRLVRTAALLVLVGWIRSLQLRVQMHPFASRSLHGGLRVWPMLPREISFVFNPKSFLFLLSHSEYRSPLRRGNKN